MNNTLIQHLNNSDKTLVKQRRELAELFGFETRNKYELFTEDRISIGFCAEQQKGFFGFLFRQFLGHWRRFNLVLFDSVRNPIYRVKHPFRFFFQRMEIYEVSGEKGETFGTCIGALEQRFGIFTKKFDLEDGRGSRIGKMRSGFFKLWSFPIKNMRDEEVGKIEKKWGGALKEIFTDQDTFLVTYQKELPLEEKVLLLASSVFIDLKYFENNQGASPLNILSGGD